MENSLASKQQNEITSSMKARWTRPHDVTKGLKKTMPVIRTSEKVMGKGNRPEWSGVTSAGIFRIPAEGGRMDSHYHDCNEWWLIFSGKAKIMSEGGEFHVKAGDIVCTKASVEHDVLEVYEDLEAFWFEVATPEGGRVGHLHKSKEKAKGHSVRARPLPVDFPK